MPAIERAFIFLMKGPRINAGHCFVCMEQDVCSRGSLW